LRNQALDLLVTQCEYKQEAQELDVKVSDKEVDDRLAQIKKQYFSGDEKKYEAQLKAQGLTDEQVHEDIRSQLLSEKIFKDVTSDVKVTDAEIHKYYTEHPQLYAQPESRDIRHILVKGKAKADQLYAQLKAGASFAALAKKNSTDPGSKDQGGKLTISKGQTVPEFDKTAFALKTNELSKPVKTQYGWHIIQAMSNVKPRKTTPEKQVKESIRQQLLQQKRNEEMTKWVNDTKKDYESKIDYQVGYAPPTTASATTATDNS
jgi:foldase protein PrsA